MGISLVDYVKVFALVVVGFEIGWWGRWWWDGMGQDWWHRCEAWWRR